MPKNTLLEETQIERMHREELKQLDAQKIHREKLEKELQKLEEEQERNLQRMQKHTEAIRKRKEERRKSHAKVMKDLKQVKKALGSGTKHSRRYLKAALKIDEFDPVKDIVNHVNEHDWYKSYKISCVRLPIGTFVYTLHSDIDNKPINGTKGKTIADVKRLMNKYPNRWYYTKKRKIQATEALKKRVKMKKN